jgi:hypothetical protein
MGNTSGQRKNSATGPLMTALNFFFFIVIEIHLLKVSSINRIESAPSHSCAP